jgi:hypothetical protein
MKCAALLCLSLVLATACAAQTTETGSISGVVRDAATGAPVRGVVVSLTFPRDGTVLNPVDTQGRYTLTGIPQGTYRIRASSPLQKDQIVTVTLEAGQNLTSVDFQLPNVAFVSGRVLDENDKAVPNAQVFFAEKLYDYGALWYSLGSERAWTDETGAYRLTGIPAGTAILVEAQLRRAVTDGDTPADTFYPHALSVQSAMEIVLSPGETLSGVDIRQIKLPCYCVDGAVEGGPESALDLATKDVLFLDSFSHSAQTRSVGRTEPNGTFHVCGLHRGQFAFAAVGSSADAGRLPFYASGALEVTNHDVRDFKCCPPWSPLFPQSSSRMLARPCMRLAPQVKSFCMGRASACSRALVLAPQVVFPAS